MDSDTGHPRRWLILAILSLSLIVIGLDILIITIALPEIQTDLGATAGELQWTVNAYTLAFGGLLLLCGNLADRYGRKLLLLLGLLAFLGFSIGATYAQSSEALIICRAGMGLGSAMIMPTTLAIIKHVFPPHEQSRAIAIWTAAAGIGVPLGPIVGGVLLNDFWWGSVFLINVPVAGLALAGALLLIPESREQDRRSVDVVGAVLSVGGLVALVYGLIQGPEQGWGDPATIGLLVGGPAALVAFAVWETRTASPMIDGRLFRDPRFGGPAFAIVCIAFALFGSLFLVTQYLQFGLQLEPLDSGLRMLAICALIVASGIAPVIAQRVGLKAAIGTGLAFITASALVLSSVDLTNENRVLIALALLGFGLGLAMPPAADSILASAPREQSGAGSAVTDTSMQVGGALGVAVIGSVLSTTYRNEIPDTNNLAADAQAAVHDSLGGASGVAAQLGSGGADLLRQAQSAFEAGLHDAALTGAAVAAVGTLVALVVLPMRMPPAESPSPDGSPRPDVEAEEAYPVPMAPRESLG